MSAITCLTCNVAFEDVDLGRIHYKSDWHRYNLKRKVAGYAPVTLEAFEERQLSQEKQASTAQQEHHVCKPCNKSFGSVNAYENHMQSKKHKEVMSHASEKSAKKSTGKDVKQNNRQRSQNVAKANAEDVNVDMDVEDDDDSDVESWDSYDKNCLGLEECLFCSFISMSLEDNLKHMTADHGFFLPDAEYISDLEGLITYLGEKVGAGHLCLWCNEKGKRFHDTRDVQRHMVDKCHCKLLHEGEVLYEYADFYNYISSYPDSQIPDVNPDVNPEETVDITELDGDGFSLTLPSGITIGHRSLMKYYRQNMVPHYHDQTKRVLPKMLAHYKALGWTGSTGHQVEQRAKDLQCLQRGKKRHFMQLGVKANNLRHHFRDQNL